MSKLKLTITEGENRCPICDSYMEIDFNLRGNFQCEVCKSTLTLAHGPETVSTFELGDPKLRTVLYFPWASVIPMILLGFFLGSAATAITGDMRNILLYPLAVTAFMVGTYHYDRWMSLRRLRRGDK